MDNMIAGAILGAVMTLSLQKPKRVDTVARAKICRTLERHYTPGTFTPQMYDWCLLWGPEDTFEQFGHKLK